MDLIAETVERTVGGQGQPSVLHLPPQNFDQVQLRRVGRQVDQIHSMRHPLHYLVPESLGAMHAGIVEHHHGEGVWVFLGHKLVKCLDDGLRRNRLGGGVVNQLPCSAKEPQHVQPSAM